MRKDYIVGLTGAGSGPDPDQNLQLLFRASCPVSDAAVASESGFGTNLTLKTRCRFMGCASMKPA